LVARVLDADGLAGGPESITPLPGLLLPGRDVAVLLPVAVPERPGTYQVEFGVRRLQPDAPAAVIADERLSPRLTLLVADVAPTEQPPPVVPANLEPVLRAAQECQRLPDGYVDVSEGWSARWKQWLKHKLLHNFQHAYVDVLSRQQSAFNRQILSALAELGDGQAALANALDASPPRPNTDLDAPRKELKRLRRQNRGLRRRLARVEALLAADHPSAQETPA
jgi:hypothetical protein